MVIAELNEAKAAALSAKIMQAGGEALAVTTDVAVFRAGEGPTLVTGQVINADGGATHT